MKTLAIRSDFDFKSSGFRVLGSRVLGSSGFGVLGSIVFERKQLEPNAGISACQRICGIRRGQS